MPRPRKPRRLADTYTFPGFQPLAYVQGIFGDPQARLVTLVRRTKKRSAARVPRRIGLGTTAENVMCGIFPAEIIGSISSWRCGEFSAAVVAMLRKHKLAIPSALLRRKSALVVEIIQRKTTVAEASRAYDLPPVETIGVRSQRVPQCAKLWWSRRSAERSVRRSQVSAPKIRPRRQITPTIFNRDGVLFTDLTDAQQPGRPISLAEEMQDAPSTWEIHRVSA